MWFTLLASLLTGLFGSSSPITAYLNTKAQAAKAAADLAMQVEVDKKELSKEYASNDLAATQARLNATSQNFKAFSFILINIPIVVTCINRNWGEYIWANLNTVPTWYAQMYVAVVLVIWGIPVAANAANVIFQSVTDAWLQRNQGKIQKLQVINEAVLAASLRETLFKEGMTQWQWDAIISSIKAAKQAQPTSQEAQNG